MWLLLNRIETNMAGWRTDIVIDPGTFGNSKACHCLVDMMNDNVISVYEKHRVLAFITNATHHFRGVSHIPHKGIREATNKMWLDLFLNRIDERSYPAKFTTFYKNVIYYLSRKYLEGVV